MKRILASFTIFSLVFILLIIIYNNYKIRIDNQITDTYTQIEAIQSTIAPKPTVIQFTGLPDQHLISTLFVPQAPEHNWDQPWQDACEEAALLTVDYYYKNSKPPLETIIADLKSLFKYETDQGWTHDIHTSQMSQIATEVFNLKPQLINNPTIEDLKKYIAQNIPVIIPASGKTLFKENHYFKSGGPWYHAVVLLGYDDNKKQFIVHDVGTQFGAYHRYSYDVLMDSIHDFPADEIKEHINNGDKNVLVLLK